MTQTLSRASLGKLPQSETSSTKSRPRDFQSVISGQTGSYAKSEISAKLPDDLREILK